MRRYLSWIEGLTTNQYVGGSNPSRRTTELPGQALCLALFFASSENDAVIGEYGTKKAGLVRTPP